MWKTLGCAVQGRGHIANNIPCQDKISSLSLNGVESIALADGAGSARLSHFGAKVVTDYICKKLCSDFDSIYSDSANGSGAANEIISEINGCLGDEAKRLDCSIKDLASTLLAVAIKGEDILAVHLGDGVIGCIKSDGIKVIFSPDNGEFANTTVFTTSKHAVSSIKLIKGLVKDKLGFVLMSDGSCASLYDKQGKRLSNGIKKIVDSGVINKSTALNEQLVESFKYDVRAKTNDDCSIAIVYKDTDKFDGYLNLTSVKKREILKKDSCDRIYKDNDKIIRYVALEDGKSMSSIQSWFHKKTARIKYAVNRLERMNLVYEKDGIYKAVIKIDVNEDDKVLLNKFNDIKIES